MNNIENEPIEEKYNEKYLDELGRLPSVEKENKELRGDNIALRKQIKRTKKKIEIAIAILLATAAVAGVATAYANSNLGMRNKYKSDAKKYFKEYCEELKDFNVTAGKDMISLGWTIDADELLNYIRKNGVEDEEKFFVGTYLIAGKNFAAEIGEKLGIDSDKIISIDNFVDDIVQDEKEEKKDFGKGGH